MLSRCRKSDAPVRLRSSELLLYTCQPCTWKPKPLVIVRSTGICANVCTQLECSFTQDLVASGCPHPLPPELVVHSSCFGSRCRCGNYYLYSVSYSLMQNTRWRCGEVVTSSCRSAQLTIRDVSFAQSVEPMKSCRITAPGNREGESSLK